MKEANNIIKVISDDSNVDYSSKLNVIETEHAIALKVTNKKEFSFKFLEKIKILIWTCL